MSDVKVKICGVTTEADARACLDAGADYIGLIFAESERRVTRAQAEAIRKALPDAKLVGVFAGHNGVQIAEIARLANLDLVQMHGGEPLPLRIAVKERTGLPVARVLHAETIIDPASPFADDTLLYDLPKGRAHSTEELERLWEAARRGSDSHHRVFLAGGLNPDNVAEAVRAVHPYAVDVSRGVESAPGVKDLALVRRFIEEVRGA